MDAIRSDGGKSFLSEICRIVELAALSHLSRARMATGESGTTYSQGELAVVTVSIMGKFAADDSSQPAIPKNM